MGTVSRAASRIRAGDFRALWYALWIRFKHLDFELATPDSLGLSTSQANHYSNSGGPELESVLKSLDIQPTDRILDYGSGKGGATFTMSQFPFAEVLGIELSPELITVARRNAELLNIRNVSFECCNATEFNPDRFTHAYLFNPFPATVCEEVHKGWLASLDRSPRPLTVICKYPEGCLPQCFQNGFRLVNKFEFAASHPFYVLRSVT